MKDFEIEFLANGILLFRNAIEIDQDSLIPYLYSLKKKAEEEDYTIIYSDSREPLYAINRSGHRYSLDDLGKSCSHIMEFAKKTEKENTYYSFFQKCEQTIYECLLRYIEKYPTIAPCLWWKTQGHVVAYSPGSEFGLHADNDVNYQPGAIPDQQLATRNVLGVIIYFNNSVESEEVIKDYEYNGGEITFPYLDVTYSPKSGDILFFPSNFLASHEVSKCKNGYRYAYVSYFAQGSSDPSRGVDIRESNSEIDSGQVWIPQLFDDYLNYLQEKYGDLLFEYPDLTRSVTRSNTSNGTSEEVMKEKERNTNDI